MISPKVLMVSLRCSKHPPMYSWYPPDVLMVSPQCTHGIPPMYSWYPSDVLNTHYTGCLSFISYFLVTVLKLNKVTWKHPFGIRFLNVEKNVFLRSHLLRKVNIFKGVWGILFIDPCPVHISRYFWKYQTLFSKNQKPATLKIITLACLEKERHTTF